MRESARCEERFFLKKNKCLPPPVKVFHSAYVCVCVCMCVCHRVSQGCVTLSFFLPKRYIRIGTFFFLNERPNAGDGGTCACKEKEARERARARERERERHTERERARERERERETSRRTLLGS